MVSPATNSSIEVAYWFFDRAEKDDIYLENERLHHLLFLAQSRFAQTHFGQMLMPCLFLCDESGFFEPNIKKMFALGRPFMPQTQLEDTVATFLENIWKQYGSLSLAQFKQIVTALPLFDETYQKGTQTVVDWNSLIDKSNDCGTIRKGTGGYTMSPKVLVSQNGPVVVSQWKPRKVNSTKHKDYLHE